MTYRVGDYKMLCDRCGAVFPKSYMKYERLSNLWTCGPLGSNCYTGPDVFDLAINVPHKQRKVEFCRPLPEYEISCYSDAIVDIAVVDCTTIDFTTERVTIGG